MKKIIKCISSIGLGSMISIGVICHGGPGDKADGNNPNNDPNNNPNNINNNLQKINTGDVNNNPDINPNNINNPGNDEPTVTKSGYTAWVSADEATDDVFRWGNGGVNGDYIKGKIKATTKEALDSRNKAKIENALCKLWESGGSIGSVSSTILGLIEYTKGATNINEKLKEVVNNNIVVGPLANSLIKNNLSPDDFMKIRNNLVRVLESKQLELASEIVGSDNKQGMTDDDFVSLAFGKASIWEAIRNKKFYDFESCVKQMIAMYNDRKNSKYRELIKKEFENLIEKYNGDVGPFGNSIKNFKGLKYILNE